MTSRKNFALRLILPVVAIVSFLGVPGLAVASPVTLTFTTAAIPYGSPGSFGDYGSINLGGGVNTTGYNIAISTLVVSGTAFDGSYAVTGTVYNNQYGALNFSTSPGSQYVYIDGAVPSLGVSQTRLLAGTGGTNGFTGLAVGSTNCTAIGFPSFYTCFTISFTTPDTKAATLLASLGLAGTTQWSLATFDIGAGSGNNFPEYSVTAVNTAVPEPATLGLLGLGLLGLGAALRARRR